MFMRPNVELLNVVNPELNHKTIKIFSLHKNVQSFAKKSKHRNEQQILNTWTETGLTPRREITGKEKSEKEPEREIFKY